MKNTNNKITNILLVVLIFTVLGVGYVITRKSTIPENTLPLTLEESPSASQPDWKNISKNKFESVLSKEPDVFFEKDFGLTLSEEIDLTGDGIKEAIVTGDGGNNSISFVFKKEGDNLIALKQKNKDGSISPVSLYEVGRVMVNVNFKLLPSEKGFYTASMVFDESANNQETSHFICDEESVNAYTWNENSKMFIWNQILTTKYTKEVCI